MTRYPVNGSFYNYSLRFIDPAWGFAMGWNYAINWLIVLPFELTAAGLTIGFWTKDPSTGEVPARYNVGIWITCFLLLVVVINVAGVRGYGEVEFVLGMIKVTAIIGFIILGIIINCGGVPTDNRYTSPLVSISIQALTLDAVDTLVVNTGVILERSETDLQAFVPCSS